MSPVDDQSRSSFGSRLLKPFTELFGFSRAVAAVTVALIAAIVVLAVWYFIHLAPPKVITISAGPEQSSYWKFATNYQQHLASNHITLNILTSQGSQENLQRLGRDEVDIGFVQSGITNKDSLPQNIVSLGSVGYQPLLIFYRSETNYTLLSQFKGQRLAVGAPGSGTRILAMNLLSANGVNATNARMLDIEASSAAKALLATNADAVFLTGDSAPTQVLTNLLRRPDIKLFSFVQADAYARRISYLNKMDLPMGSLDLAANLPKETVYLVAPTIELVAREKLHAATIDLLIETARDVHGRATILQKKKDFPKLVELDIPISKEAERYYTSGRVGTYRLLPFWLANIVNRILLVFVPAIVLLIPAMKLIPVLVRLKVRLKLFRWYRALLALERDMFINGQRTPPGDLLPRLDDIEQHVSKIKVPASYADQYYTLRGHISFVRNRLHTPDTR
jgi:TRAP transporter TAXI family solute receptor